MVGRWYFIVALLVSSQQGDCLPVSASPTPFIEVPPQTPVVNLTCQSGLGLPGDYELCDICLEAVDVALKLVASNRTFQDIKPYANSVCVKVLTSKGYQGYSVCPGIVESYGPGSWFILGQLFLDPASICSKLNYCMHNLKTPTHFKSAGLDTSKRKQIKLPKSSINSLGKTDPLKILQISDIHLDPYYTVGAATDCGLFLCCRKNFNGTGSAGIYGDYHKCDLPIRTLDIMLSAIKSLNPAPDFIIYTGDSPSHDVWQENWGSQLFADQFVYDTLASKLSEFQIYPSIGNHESFPESFYYQPDQAYQLSERTLKTRAATIIDGDELQLQSCNSYDKMIIKVVKRWHLVDTYLNLNSKLADWWGELFNITFEQRDTIQQSAYYTTLVQPGLRILSFNTDYGYLANFYFLLNDHIPAYRQQMSFMETVLSQAREAKEKVIIIGHVPPGDHGSSTFEYGDFYTNLAVRYADVICLHLFGHTHHDTFELIVDSESQSVYGPVFIAPSVTTYGQVNPGFRVYELNRETFQLIDYQQYYFNVTAANLFGKTDVKVYYSAKAEYGMDDLGPESWRELANRMATNTTLFDVYRKNYLTGSGLEGSCDASCRRKKLCELLSSSQRALQYCINKECSKT